MNEATRTANSVNTAFGSSLCAARLQKRTTSIFPGCPQFAQQKAYNQEARDHEKDVDADKTATETFGSPT